MPLSVRGEMLSLEQAQEVLLKLGVCGGSGGVAGNEYHVVPVRQRVPVCAKYLAQAAAYQISVYSLAYFGTHRYAETIGF